ncbi:8770_t:CDS:1 [Paraglomus brasilianum]|uniref:8770_t:CDS:1 n=1 Tax=Paraglomus brasilianum TaxID=144538 RepID=A0A9N9DC87_9GLOM|nr:8770_t:CDS:1 [Paraglomus brasilianum]
MDDNNTPYEHRKERINLHRRGLPPMRSFKTNTQSTAPDTANLKGIEKGKQSQLSSSRSLLKETNKRESGFGAKAFKTGKTKDPGTISAAITAATATATVPTTLAAPTATESLSFNRYPYQPSSRVKISNPLSLNTIRTSLSSNSARSPNSSRSSNSHRSPPHRHKKPAASRQNSDFDAIPTITTTTSSPTQAFASDTIPNNDPPNSLPKWSARMGMIFPDDHDCMNAEIKRQEHWDQPTIPKREASLLWGSNASSQSMSRGLSDSTTATSITTNPLKQRSIAKSQDGVSQEFDSNKQYTTSNFPTIYTVSAHKSRNADHSSAFNRASDDLGPNSTLSNPYESLRMSRSFSDVLPRSLSYNDQLVGFDRQSESPPDSPEMSSKKLTIETNVNSNAQDDSNPDSPTPSGEKNDDSFPEELTYYSPFAGRRPYLRGHYSNYSIDSTFSPETSQVVYSMSQADLIFDNPAETTTTSDDAIDTTASNTTEASTPFSSEYSSPKQSKRPLQDMAINVQSTFLQRSPSLSSTTSSAQYSYNTDSGPPSAIVAPRKFLLQSLVLQVVNSSSTKNRYLFLFNDLLVIAEPINVEPHTIPTLDNLFQIKYIVEMSKITLIVSLDKEEDMKNKPRREPSVLQEFAKKFAIDPIYAIDYMIGTRRIINDPVHIAKLLLRSSELSKRQLGIYLADQNHKKVLLAYLDRLNFEGIYIDEALRIFLMSIVLPQTQTDINYLITAFAKRWHHANANVAKFNDETAIKLTFATLELNNKLHKCETVGKSSATLPDAAHADTSDSSVTIEDFINRFRRESDQFCLVPDNMLEKVYRSIRDEKLETAWDDTMEDTPQIPVTFQPTRLPSRLTLKEPSDFITVSIPSPDPHFYIRLHGQDLRFEPSVLDFSRQNTKRFRITGTTLGSKSMMLIKSGAHAPHYTNLPTTKTVLVERAFLRWTFEIAFTDTNGLRRKYVFSVDSQERKRQWVESIRGAINEARLKAYNISSPKFVVVDDDDKDKDDEEEETGRVSRRTPAKVDPNEAAEAVVLQVLRDALIPDENAMNDIGDRTSVVAIGGLGSIANSPTSAVSTPMVNAVNGSHPFSSPSFSSSPQSSSSPTSHVRKHNRVTSLANIVTGSAVRQSLLRNSVIRNSVLVPNSATQDIAVAAYAKTGHDIIRMAVQNSLLPIVLGYLKSELEKAENDRDDKEQVEKEESQENMTGNEGDEESK